MRADCDHYDSMLIRNRKLAARIDDGTATPIGIDEIMDSVRSMASANLDVPGPRAAQIADEVERLRGVERRVVQARDGMLAAQTAVQLWELLEWILTGTETQ